MINSKKTFRQKDGWKERMTDRQNLLYVTFHATAGGSKRHE